MPSKKKQGRINRLLKPKRETVVIIKTAIEPKDTLFPEKVASAKERLNNADFNGLL